MSLTGEGKILAYWKRALLALASVPVLLLSTGLTAQAATAPSGSASGLSISPLRQEVTLKPGQADKIDITLKNITGGPITAKAKVQDFESDNVDGNPKLITDPNQNSPNSIRNFLVGLGDIQLAVNEQRSFSIPVQAPANAAPGAYFGLVEFQAVPNNSSASAGGNNKVALSAAVSQLVFITVPGNIVSRMQLNAIHIYKDTGGNNEGLFFTKIPKAAGVELRNLGNGFATPFGRVTLTNSTGKTIYSYELNGGVTRGLVLPNSNRVFRNPLKGISRPGRYTLTASVSYGSGSAILTGKKTFWYIPAWLPFVVIIIVLVLVGIILLARRRFKRANASRAR
ncbi:MAG TPA: hypothetical protein VH234_04170 [Candidatus Saccharimonadales bacterium]|jgi:hypothetical protein|nr:hypothetical protein [Candidatus Saccharimonadales bacterium]